MSLYGNTIGDDGMKVLMGAASAGGLPAQQLYFGANEFGEAGVEALAEAVANGSLPSLKELGVDREHEENPRLMAACEMRGVDLDSIF